MKYRCVFLLSALLGLTVSAQRTAPTSETDPRLRKLPERRPETDLNKDGVLTPAEVQQARERQQQRQRNQPQKPAPTHMNVPYGPHASMTLDFWQAESVKPAPLFVFIHGGGFRGGDKGPFNPMLLEGFLTNGVSVASINYRLSGIAPYPAQMHDSARAIQFLRSSAETWNVKDIIPGTAFNDSALKPFYDLPDGWDWNNDTVDGVRFVLRHMEESM